MGRKSVDRSKTPMSDNEVIDMRMVGMMCEHTRRDRFRNEDI